MSRVSVRDSWLLASFEGDEAGAAGRADRNRKADADESAVARRPGEGGHDPTHLSPAVEQRPAGATGIDRGVELDQPAQSSAVFRLDGPVEPGDHAGGDRVDKLERVPDGVSLV